MLLTGRILSNVSNVNSFCYVDQARFTEGDPEVVYIQLLDGAKGEAPGMRYMPPATSTLSITINHINADKAITRAGSQVYPTSDPSIWSLTFLSTDTLKGTFDIKLTLTEPTRVIRGVIRHGLSILPQNPTY